MVRDSRFEESNSPEPTDKMLGPRVDPLLLVYLAIRRATAAVATTTTDSLMEPVHHRQWIDAASGLERGLNLDF